MAICNGGSGAAKSFGSVMLWPVAFVIALFVGPGLPVAQAQTAGQTLEGAVPAAPDPGRAPLPRVAVPEPAALPPGRDAAFTLRTVTVDGATALPLAALEPLWRDRLDGPYSLSEAVALADAVQGVFRDAGFVFTRVVVAEPDLEAGAVRLRVVEARIESVTIEEPDGPVGPVRALLEQMAAPLVGLENPRLADLERVLLLMNDVPGITRATAVPRPGSSGAGSQALAINVSRDPLSGALFADTRQSPAFGEGLAGALVELGGYGSGGDTTRLVGTVSFWDEGGDLDERQILQIEQERFIGGSGLQVGFRALYGRSRPGDVLEPLDLRGRDIEVEVTARYPVIRTRPLSLWVNGGFEVIQNRVDLGSSTRITEDNRRILYAGAEALVRDPYGFTAVEAELRKGFSAFGGSDKGDALLSRFDGDPEAVVLRASFERDVVFDEHFSLNARAEGQYASAPLLADEEFALGGTTFGRGYDPSELLGDHGVGATAELRWRRGFALAEQSFTVELYGFGDVGRIWNRDDGTPAAQNIASYGGGVRAFLPGNVLLGAELAKPTRTLRRTDEDDVRLFFIAQKRF